ELRGQTTMTPQNVDRNDPRRISFESACRDYWIAFVRMETGERPGDGTTLTKVITLAPKLNG
ncbi:MAG: hypothetical protein WCF52_22545, partial [Pseudolabrys sp.]